MFACPRRNFSISLDGFGTGEGQALDTPFGHAGQRLHQLDVLHPVRPGIFGESGGTEGRRSGDGRAARTRDRRRDHGLEQVRPPGWQDDPEWRGWWGDEPAVPHADVRPDSRPRPFLEMDGGTTFHFLEAVPADALEVARDAAAGQDVRIGGGPTMLARLPCRRSVHDLHVVQVPILLGRVFGCGTTWRRWSSSTTWGDPTPRASPTSRSPDDRSPAKGLRKPSGYVISRAAEERKELTGGGAP